MKNVTLYWPLWALYTLALLILLPGQLWLGSSASWHTGELSEDYIVGLLSSGDMSVYLLLISAMAIATGSALFSYLFQTRTANMIHALPVDRNQLFGTNVISGLSFLIVPQIVSFLVAMLYCINRGISHLEYLVVWLVMSVCIAFVMYAIVTFCSFLTGQLITMLAFVGLINTFSLMASGLVEFIFDIFAYGMDSNVIPTYVTLWCSPWSALSCFHVEALYENEKYVGMHILGEEIIVVYSIIAILLYVVSWVLYKKRHIEHTGDFLTVSFLKPVFRYGVGICMAMLLAPGVYATFVQIGKTIPIPLFAFIFVIVGMIGYWVADMLIKKTFKVFKKKYLLRWGIYAVVLTASCIGIYISTNVYETAIPNKEEVAYAKICSNYWSKFEQEELDKVFNIHKAIIEQKDLFEGIIYDYGSYDYDYIKIYYYAEDGKAIATRHYYVPYNIEEGISIYEMVWEYEKEPKRLLNNLFCEGYENITTFGSGYVEYPLDYNAEEDSWVFGTKECDSNSAKKLYEAVIADAYEGRLYEQNTNLNSQMMQKFKEESVVEITSSYKEDSISVETQDIASYDAQNQIVISFKLPNAIQPVSIKKTPNSISELVYDMDYNYMDSYYDFDSGEEWKDSYINFDKNCTNIVNALLELGMIESVDQLK